MNTKDSHSLSWERVKAEFQRIWGYEDFRPPQGEIIRSLLSRQDALVVMPTGGGKSICFQLPALLQTGLTLVVSPLVALMENQVQELREKNLPAALLHSQMPSLQRRQTLRLLEQNRLRLLYLSPETLLSSSVWNLIAHPRILVNGLILDEAHCLVQWGDTFRPTYRRLGAIRPALLQLKQTQKNFAIAAFTATANPAAQDTIKTVLDLQNPKSFLLNPYRPNLNLNIQTVWTPRGRRQQLLKFIQTRQKQTGLVYVRTRKDSEELADSLKLQGYQTAAYHAGLSGEERREIEQAWLKGSLKFVVCTSAFGMGINKPNVRWVLHFQAPFLLSEYLQEVGRAGRDGKPAIALTLVSEPTGFLYPEDKQRREYLQENWRKQYQQANQLIKKLPKQGEIEEISRQFRNSAIALSVLHSSGQLTWQDPFHYIINSKAVAFPDHNTQAIKQMSQYLNTRQCRWRFLLEAFGFGKEAKSMACGHCDNCRK
ncbi:RecQ family ATP-dependent DNA helicase [Capilliphycus salinus ALCB114379]|uniref:RecQ family ATP-dependent DNA helicase n=1 Tax=Capilliphycus salinus TaxID=2768948 RepID=UPI0039A5167A